MLLGFTTGTGLACTQVKANGVSKAFGAIGNWFSEAFKGEGESSHNSSQTSPLDPVTPLAEAWERVSEATKTVIGIVPAGYTWIKADENFKWLLGFFKNFADFKFAKNLVFNFHLTVRAWLGVLVDRLILSKFPIAIKKFQSLAQFLSKNESQTSQDVEKEMINWLYLRFLVNPRRTVNVLARGQRLNSQEGAEGLKCNGGKKKKKAQDFPLGACFLQSDGKKLIDKITNFLKSGIIPPTSPKEK